MNKSSFLTGTLYLCSVLSVFLSFTNTTYPQDMASGTEGDACITSECHAGIGENKFMHTPLKEGQCSACHGELPEHKGDPEKYRFEQIEEISKNCFSCHTTYKGKKFIHYPVAEGDCSACHSPHGAPYKDILLEMSGTLCFNCHDEELVSKQFIHGPADAGGCIACHDPHASEYEKNLRTKSPELCFMCHTEMGIEFQEAKVIHKPVAEDCTNCHNPHSAEKQFMLDLEAPHLCFNCHKEKKKEVMDAEVQHGALMVGKSCLNCHEPHVSNVEKRLSMAPLDLCLSCHDREVETPDGRLLTNMKKLLEENQDHHGPIKERDCAGCHNPHGSDEFRILREKYPSQFYMPFKADNYNLCFKCHEKTIVQSAATTTLTNFRNGDDNLHFKHINKPVKGRTCRACHETHASNYPKHIRQSVPFGKWEFDINYEKTETGGSCLPGCHKLKTYDRVNKAGNK